jgi:hypothetical protein
MTMAITFEKFDVALQLAYESLLAEKAVSEYVGGLLVDIYNMSDEVVQTFADGFSFGDITRLGSIVPMAMARVESIEGLTGDEKKKLVRDIVLVAYTAIDRGSDGEQNNINIPFVFGSIERSAELFAINLVVNFVVDGLFNYMQSKGDVNKGA